MNIGIVGLGLIGGSLALALKKEAQKNRHVVFGFDTDCNTLQETISSGAVDFELTPEALSGVSVLLIALYPVDAVEFVRTNAQHISPGTIVADCCGVKQAVCEPLFQIAREHGFYYVGTHPMAGREKSGFSAADPNLFKGASMVITPGTSPEEASAAETLEEICREIGFAQITYTTPREHDRIIALTSQLAHLLSCAFLESETSLSFKGFSAGSFLDMTRVARLNERMWTELFLLNREFLAEETDALANRLKQYAALIRSENEDELFQRLGKARMRKEEIDKICDFQIERKNIHENN